jgi:hypothetical protein
MNPETNKKIIYVSPSLHINGSVAIVGSSGSLLNKNYGKFIDTFDNVIRFNRAEVSEKYKDHTGLKTTLRVVNNHVFDNVDISKYGYTNSPKNFVKKLRNTNILYMGPDEEPWKRRKKNTHKSNNLFRFDYSQLEKLKHDIGIKTDKNLQIGTIMIALCVFSNQKPNLFGFDLVKTNRTHYYENRPSKPNYQVHSPDLEIEAIKKLASKSNLKIY